MVSRNLKTARFPEFRASDFQLHKSWRRSSEVFAMHIKMKKIMLEGRRCRFISYVLIVSWLCRPKWTIFGVRLRFVRSMCTARTVL